MHTISGGKEIFDLLRTAMNAMRNMSLIIPKMFKFLLQKLPVLPKDMWGLVMDKV